MQDIAEFLRTHEPFSGLDEEGLERLAELAEEEVFEAGATIFKEGEPSQDRVLMVRRGAIELAEGGRVLDLLGQGELFGHPSMLVGLPSGLEARAQEESLCYSMAASDVIPLLERPSSPSRLNRSLLRRREPGGAAAEANVASAEMAQQAARALIRREPVTCTADRPLREVSQVMSDENVNSMIVRAESGELGIVTDGDLRSRVIAEGMPVDTPVGEAVSAPLTTVGADAAGADVMLAMLDHDVRHVGVLSPRGELLGVLGGIDLVAAEARAPFALRREIARARDKEELSEAAQRLRSTVVALHATKLPPQQIGRVISVVADALIRRMIELAIESKGAAPAEFAWLALGSHGRRETVPSSDVDSGMAWGDVSEQESSGPDPQRVIAPEGGVGYMRAIAADVEDCIRVVGWRLDPHGVTASGEFSASSMDTWRRSIGHWLENPGDEKVLIASSILLDGRTVYGPAELDPRPILLEPANRTRLLPSMLRLALAVKPPTGFRGNIVVEDSGEHRGTFDIKRGGLLPVVDIARFGALKAGATVTTTIERLRAASELEAIEPVHARTLEEAYDLFSSLRLEHQIQQLERGNEPSDYVDPKELSELTRRYLRDAFHEVAAVQKSLSSGRV
ncbi:MAG TPA: putative nucleotidyltransferase substrate binding domain-containing protein [Solirubrobacterales bacterium]|nr:putative nucleotidyltransferase substrate binding domain-containing protein [Solirubrobacterales bacterium]